MSEVGSALGALINLDNAITGLGWNPDDLSDAEQESEEAS